MERKWLLLPMVALVAGLLQSSEGLAQSFSCQMAHTVDEEIVCRSRWLRRLDIIMAEQYQALRAHVRRQRAVKREAARQWGTALAREQQAFVAARAACGADEECIGRAYEQRIGSLVAMWREMLK